MSTHAGEIIAACHPKELVVLRRMRDGRRVARVIGAVPLADRDRTLRMAKLHLDATRSAALFAERMAIVEGVTEAVLVRQLGRAWAADDPHKMRFIDALTITVMGAKVGEWPVDLLATPGFEIANRIAILSDTDARGGEAFAPPAWLTARDPDVVRGFYSAPTLEPSLIPGNIEAATAALTSLGLSLPHVTPNEVDAHFHGTGRRRKGEFALALAAEFARRLDAGEQVTVPVQVRDMLDYLYAAEEEDDADPPPVDG